MNQQRELLFSVTAADCDWQYIKGTGPGGQKRNKTASKVRCTHRASGAIAESDETRSQHDNKKIAFKKMSETKEFKAWHKMECARRMGTLANIEENVDKAMQDHNLRVEGKVDGKWTPITEIMDEQEQIRSPNS